MAKHERNPDARPQLRASALQREAAEHSREKDKPLWPGLLDVTPKRYHAMLAALFEALEDPLDQSVLAHTFRRLGFAAGVVHLVDVARDASEKMHWRGEARVPDRLDEQALAGAGKVLLDVIRLDREARACTPKPIDLAEYRDWAVKWLPHYHPDADEVLTGLLGDSDRRVSQWAAWHLCSLAPLSAGLDQLMLQAALDGWPGFHADNWVTELGPTRAACEALLRLAAERTPREPALEWGSPELAEDGVRRWYVSRGFAPPALEWHASPGAAGEAALATIHEGWMQRRKAGGSLSLADFAPTGLQPGGLREGMRATLGRPVPDPRSRGGRDRSWVYNRKWVADPAREATLQSLEPLHHQMRALVAGCGHGQSDLSWLRPLQQLAALQPLYDVSRSCSWWIPMRDVCHLSPLDPIKGS